MIIEIFLHTVYHPLMIILYNALSDILTLKFDPLLSPSNGILQMSVVVVVLFIKVMLVLINDVLLFSQKVINLGLLTFSTIVLLG